MASMTSINAALGLGCETTAGTAVAPTQFPFVSSVSIVSSATHHEPNHVTRLDGYQIGTPQQGSFKHGFEAAGPYQYNKMGWFWKGVDDTIATTGPSGSTYTHTVSPGTPQDFTVEIRPSGEVTEALTIAGVKFSELELTLPIDGLAEWKVKGVGMSTSTPATATTIAYPTANEVNGCDITTFTLGSTDLAPISNGLSIKITQVLEELYPAGRTGGKHNPNEIKYKQSRTLEISTTVRLPIATWHDFQALHIASPSPTENTLTVTCTDSATGETFTLVGRRCTVTAQVLPTVAGEEIVTATLTLKARGTLGGSAAWTVTMTNTDASPIQT